MTQGFCLEAFCRLSTPVFRIISGPHEGDDGHGHARRWPVPVRFQNWHILELDPGEPGRGIVVGARAAFTNVWK